MYKYSFNKHQIAREQNSPNDSVEKTTIKQKPTEVT